MIGEAEGTDVAGENGVSLGDYNGETVWVLAANSGKTVYAAKINTEKGDYQLQFDLATADGNSTGFLQFGLSSHPDGVKVSTHYASAEWKTITKTISFTQTGSCFLYAQNSTAYPFYIRNIRIVRLYPAASTAEA